MAKQDGAVPIEAAGEVPGTASVVEQSPSDTPPATGPGSTEPASTELASMEPASTEAALPERSVEPAPPITNRFLLVTVAALRARQLRRGALPRLTQRDLDRIRSSRLESVAMEEVRQGLVHMDVPQWAAAGLDGDTSPTPVA